MRTFIFAAATRERLLLGERQRVERAVGDEHAADDEADAQVGVVARHRRPLEAERGHRRRDEAVDARRLRRRRRRSAMGSGATWKPIAGSTAREHAIDVPDPEARLLQLGAHRAPAACARRRSRGRRSLRRGSGSRCACASSSRTRAQAAEHVGGLGPGLEDAGDARDAHRRRDRLAGHAAREDAVELAARDARHHLELVAGDAAHVELEAQGAVGLGLDVARHGAELARPAGAFGDDGADAQRLPPRRRWRRSMTGAPARAANARMALRRYRNQSARARTNFR